jgi:hypothetical protein
MSAVIGIVGIVALAGIYVWAEIYCHIRDRHTVGPRPLIRTDIDDTLRAIPGVYVLHSESANDLQLTLF